MYTLPNGKGPPGVRFLLTSSASHLGYERMEQLPAGAPVRVIELWEHGPYLIADPTGPYVDFIVEFTHVSDSSEPRIAVALVVGPDVLGFTRDDVRVTSTGKAK